MAIHVIRAYGPPTGAPPAVGAHWFDLTNQVEWLSYGTATVADWIQGGSGAGAGTGWAGPDVVASTEKLTVAVGRQAHVLGSIEVDGVLEVDGKLFQFDENFG